MSYRASVNQETLGLDLIDELGFKGDFLTTDNTYRHFREQWAPTLFDRNAYGKWKNIGSPDLKGRVHQRIEQILSQHRCRELPPGSKQRLKAISEEARKNAIGA